MAQVAGEIYFIGEKDLRTRAFTQYYKVGIVRENIDNADRDSTHRLREHQTGNPRELFIHGVVKTYLVELVETLLHKKFAPLGVRGEWMCLNPSELEQVMSAAEEFAKEAKDIAEDLQAVEVLVKTKSDGVILQSTPELLALNESYLQSGAKLKLCEEMQAQIKVILANALDAEEGGEDVSVFVEVQERKGRSVFDLEGFKAKYLDIYVRFTSSTTSIKGTASFSGTHGFKTEIVEFDTALAAFAERFNPLVEDVMKGKESKEKLHGFNLELLFYSAEAKWSKMKAESKIKVACGSHDGIEGILKWIRTESVKESFDKKALADAHPDLVTEFTTQGEDNAAVIVAPKRGC